MGLGRTLTAAVFSPESKGVGGLKVPGTFAAHRRRRRFPHSPESKGAGGLKVPGTFAIQTPPLSAFS